LEKHHLLKLSNRFRILPLFISCYFIFSPNECVWFRIPKIWKFFKPFISKEWVHITHPNTFLYFTTTDGQIFLSRHNQKWWRKRRKRFFFQTYSLFFSDFLHDCSLHLSLRSEGMPRFLPDCSHGMQSQVFKKFCLTLNTTVLHDSRFSLQI